MIEINLYIIFINPYYTNFDLRYCLSLMYFIKDTNIKKINIKYQEIIYTMRRKINCGAIRSQRGKIIS